MEHNNNHPTFPIMSIILGIISIITNNIDKITAIDAGLLMPLAHIVAIGAGTASMIIGCISIKEKYESYRKSKKKK